MQRERGKAIGVGVHIYMFVDQFLPARASEQGNVIGLVSVYINIYYIPPPLTVHFSMTRSVRYQPILHTLYYTLHTEHAYCLSYRFLNNVVITTVIEIVEMVEILMEDLVSVQLSE